MRLDENNLAASLGLRGVSSARITKMFGGAQHFPVQTDAGAKLRISKPQFAEPDRKFDLAAIGHGLELLPFFPRFLFVPWDGGSSMIVWIGHQGGLFLRCA